MVTLLQSRVTMLNHHKTMRTRQHLLLARETVRSLLSPAFAGNGPQDPQHKDKQPKDKQPKENGPLPGNSDAPGPSCAPVCPR